MGQIEFLNVDLEIFSKDNFKTLKPLIKELKPIASILSKWKDEELYKISFELNTNRELNADACIFIFAKTLLNLTPESKVILNNAENIIFSIGIGNVDNSVEDKSFNTFLSPGTITMISKLEAEIEIAVYPY